VTGGWSLSIGIPRLEPGNEGIITDSLDFEYHLALLQDAGIDPFGIQRIDDFLINVLGLNRLRDTVRQFARLE
jgi:hypothetical protein